MCKKIPDISGLWEYQMLFIKRNNDQEVPDLHNIRDTKPTIGKMKQNGEFVIFELLKDNCEKPNYQLGTLTKTFMSSETYVCNLCGENNNNFFWSLNLCDSDDNGSYSFTTSDITFCGKINEWTGHYSESGFAGQSPYQAQTAGIVRLKRVVDQDCSHSHSHSDF